MVAKKTTASKKAKDTSAEVDTVKKEEAPTKGPSSIFDKEFDSLTIEELISAKQIILDNLSWLSDRVSDLHDQLNDIRIPSSRQSLMLGIQQINGKVASITPILTKINNRITMKLLEVKWNS